jgi:NAD-dependent dihydropyrimidine dehydrogenase PreA subunit
LEVEIVDLKAILLEEWANVRRLRYLRIQLDPDRCTGAWQCYEVCPVGLWTPNYETRIVDLDDDTLPCIACGACVLQCPSGAIRLTVPSSPA